MFPHFVNFLRDFLSQPRILITPVYKSLGYVFILWEPNTWKMEVKVTKMLPTADIH